jgi:hypothetical protein
MSGGRMSVMARGGCMGAALCFARRVAAAHGPLGEALAATRGARTSARTGAWNGLHQVLLSRSTGGLRSSRLMLFTLEVRGSAPAAFAHHHQHSPHSALVGSVGPECFCRLLKRVAGLIVLCAANRTTLFQTAMQDLVASRTCQTRAFEAMYGLVRANAEAEWIPNRDEGGMTLTMICRVNNVSDSY